MVTFDQLVARVQEHLDRTDPDALYTVERVVRATINGLGFYVSEVTGEVGDPRPRPVVVLSNDPPRRRRRR